MTIIDEGEYRAARESVTIFEDEHSFSFGRIAFSDRSIKFGWNSKGLIPKIQHLEELSVVFVGIDQSLFAFNNREFCTIFFVKTNTNFKWFDYNNSILAAVTETSIIFIDVINGFEIVNTVAFGDIIMDTAFEENLLRVSFLSNDDEHIPFLNA